MISVVRIFSLLALAVLLLADHPGAGAQVAVPGGPSPGGSGASFRTVPTAPAVAPPGLYYPPTYNGPLGGALSGTADVIGAQGQFAIDQQKAVMEREKIKQARIQTRRQTFDEHMYERAVGPTAEDEAEKARLEHFRTSRNDPPLTLIWSGSALNDLLLAIQRQQAQGQAGRDIPLTSDILAHINVTGGQNNNSPALLKNGERLSWPTGLAAAPFTADRQALDKLAQSAYQQAGSGNVDPNTIQQMTATANNLQKQLTRNVANMDPNDYIASKRFIADLNAATKALQSADVSNYVNGAWQAQGQTVGQLVQYLTGQGLRFAPALPAGQAAYVALHRAVVAYYPGPDPNKPWDPLAK